MVLPVNTMTAGEALNLASQASLRGSQEFAQNLESIQKMKEAREWASKEQKDMRSAQARAATAEAEAKTMEMELINENPDLVRQNFVTGTQAKIAESMKQKTTADLDSLYMYFGNSRTADEIEMGIKNAMADGRTDLVAKLPPIEAMRQDPRLVQQVRQQLATGYQERAYRQKQELMNQEQDQAMTRLGSEQRFRAGESGLERGLRRDLANLDAAVTMRGQDISRETGLARAAAAGQAAGADFPKKVADALGETSTNFKTKTIPNLVLAKLQAAGLTAEKKSKAVAALSMEIGAQVISDWNKAKSAGKELPDPHEMADKLAEYHIAAGRFKEGGFMGDDVLLPEESDADMVQRLSKEAAIAEGVTTKAELQGVMSRYRTSYETLVKSVPGFAELNPRDKALALEHYIELQNQKGE